MDQWQELATDLAGTEYSRALVEWSNAGGKVSEPDPKNKKPPEQRTDEWKKFEETAAYFQLVRSKLRACLNYPSSSEPSASSSEV